MPRLNVVTAPELKTNLEEYQRRAGDYNYKYDICYGCALRLNLGVLVQKTGITMEWAMDRSGNNVLGKNGQPVWEDHPEYEATEYRCEQCNRMLGEKDDPDPAGPVEVVLKGGR